MDRIVNPRIKTSILIKNFRTMTYRPNGPNGSGNYDLNSEGGDSFKLGTGHLSSYKGDKDDPIDVLEQSEKREASYLKTDEIEVTRWEVETNEQEVSQGMSDDNSEIEDKKEVILGKRRRTVSKYQKSPYIQKTLKNMRNVPRK